MDDLQPRQRVKGFDLLYSGANQATRPFASVLPPVYTITVYQNQPRNDWKLGKRGVKKSDAQQLANQSLKQAFLPSFHMAVAPNAAYNNGLSVSR